MSVSTLRLLYPIADAPAKEVIKEFFRLVGCFFCEVPVRSVPEAEKELKSNSGAEIDIVLNLEVFQWKKILPANEEEPLRVERVRSLDHGRRWILVDYKSPGETAKKGTQFPKKDFYTRLIGRLITEIWGDTAQARELQFIKTQFFKLDLLGSLQCKRALCVLGMGETLQMKGITEKLPASRYIGRMLSTFDRFYHSLKTLDSPDGEEGGGTSVYARYAGVNVARKVREVFSLLDESSLFPGAENGGFSDVSYFSAKYLLKELGRLYRLDDQYLGTLFLAAHVCQSEPSRETSAAFYYRKLLDLIGGRRQVLYSFVYYEYGRYLEKVKTDWELAVHYYTRAKELDPFAYRAWFKFACHEALNRKFSAANSLFMQVIQIIGEKYSGAPVPGQIKWEYLSLRSIQYLFKSYVWLEKIALERGDYSMASVYLHQAGMTVEKYKANDCLREIYDNGSQEWRDLEEYHAGSKPVLLLEQIVREANQEILDDYVVLA